MINVKFSENENKMTLSVVGHSEFAPKGSDTICAAASILTYVFAENVTKSAEMFPIDIEKEIEEGNSVISVNFRGGVDETMKAYLNIQAAAVLNGFELLSEAYPNHVRLEAEVSA